MSARVVAVVVTHNRRELLAHCLDALAAQERAVDTVVVIDNASTDGSGDVARAHPLGADVHTLPVNVGGAGGFAAGMARGLHTHDADWLWLMDDDTIPRPEALTALMDAVSAHPAPISVASSAAVWTDGREHPMNSQRVRIGVGRRELAVATELGLTPIRTASFVSILLRGSAARAHGLPYADYFIWGDDTEYSARLLRGGWGIRVPGSIVEHRTANFASWQSDPGPRFYNDVRNKLWLLGRSGSLRWWERALYGASVVAGWAGTLRRTSQRAVLLRHAARGARDAVASAPRPTTEVLAEIGPLAHEVRAIEDDATRPAASRPEPALAPAGKSPPFSLLLPVYAGDRPEWLRRAFSSATSEQTLPPSEVVLVQDGPVGPELAAEIDRLVSECPIPLRLVVLPENLRLAAALQAGLDACSHEVVARVDADDVSLPQRFATQLPMIAQGLDVVGSAMLEFDDDETCPGRLRPVVADHAAIGRVATRRNPLNHPSVVFRRSTVQAAGGYEDLPFMEDYWLWLRMLADGARVGNVEQPLVLYRVGGGVFARRGGLGPLAADWRFQRRAVAAGYLTISQAARNLAERAAYRLAPERLRTLAYRWAAASGRS